MAKKCKVIWKNEAVAVVAYNDTKVQVPAKYLDGDEIKLVKKGVSFYLDGAPAEEEPAAETDEAAAEEEENA